ncbi:MAG: HAMP domain-containing sensor histidine kinase [Chloroflexota bacterium]
MLRARLSGARGQLVLWYLSILALLLLGLGVFQSLTLASYLRTSAASELRATAHAQFAVFGPCFIDSRAALRASAPSLTQLLGSSEVAVKILTPDGQVLAEHGLGPPGATRPLSLPVGIIRQLIGSARSAPKAEPEGAGSDVCIHPGRTPLQPEYPTSQMGGEIETNGLLLIAVPLLDSSGSVLGYAVLGRSLEFSRSTLARVRVVFILGAVLALVVAALVALPIINRALRPLRAIANTAESIAAGDLGRRADLSHSPDEIGRLAHAFNTMIDRLQTALAASTASEERMGRFLADASHELRTPITVLRGTSEVLLRQREIDPEDLRLSLMAIHEETERLSRLINDLLTLSRLDAGQPLDPIPFRLRSFLERFMDRYGRLWPDRTLLVDVTALDDIDVSVDPDSLTRVLTNLLENAARYSAPGGPIHIAVDSDAQYVTLQIQDMGPGIDPQEAEALFERFVRSGTGRSRRSGGTGLGLAIVRALVEGNGGRVHMETGPHRGTTVHVTLPRAVPENQ